MEPVEQTILEPQVKPTPAEAVAAVQGVAKVEQGVPEVQALW
jgi:hypothetical protein